MTRGSDRVGPDAIDRFADFAAQARSQEAVDAFLSMFPRTPANVAIRSFVVFHIGDLPTALERQSNRLSGLSVVNRQAAVFQLCVRVGRAMPTELKGTFTILPGSHPSIHRVVTVSSSRFWREGLARLIRRAYPEALRIYFRQNEIRDALISLENALGAQHRVQISDYTVKEERPFPRVRSQKAYDTERRWTSLAVPEVFGQAEERGQWFASLRFVIERRSAASDPFSPVASGRIYKYGEIHYDSLHSELTTSLVSYLGQRGADRLSMLSGRGIREKNYNPGLPVEIAYDTDVFADPQEVRRFAKVVTVYPNASKAVFHANPYYHASVADFLDGSSFDVWVLSPRRVVLIPQAKATAQAFERLISHIFSKFEEGRMGEYGG